MRAPYAPNAVYWSAARHLGGDQLPVPVSSYGDSQMSEPAYPGIALYLLGVANDGDVPMDLDIDVFLIRRT